MGDVGHNCGYCVTHSLADTYEFLRKGLQHRGREAAGILGRGSNRIDVIKWVGEVISCFDLEGLQEIFAHLNPLGFRDYHTFGGHVRYATKGREDRILEDSHPHFIGGEVIERNDHFIVIADCEIAGIHVGQVDDAYFEGVVDPKDLRTGCDTEALLHWYREKGEHELLRKIPGAYTIAIADKRKRDVMVIRDRTGIKPGVLGKKDWLHVSASEDLALRTNDARLVEDLQPGSVYYLAPDGTYTREEVVDPALARCMFELNYIGHVDSVIDGVSVRRVRGLLGEEFAQEFVPKDADFVTDLPRCPIVTAEAYASKTGIPFRRTFGKPRWKRTFQGTTGLERATAIRENLFFLPGVEKSLEGMVIALMDDSTIRANNIQRVVQLYAGAGLRKLYVLNYTSGIGIRGEDGIERGCMFGVDMPPGDDFIVLDRSGEVRNRTFGEIAAEIKRLTIENTKDDLLETKIREMELEIVYLSVEGMKRAYRKAGVRPENLCMYCVGGEHPFKGLEGAAELTVGAT